jgi:YD repeat-containing protein
MVAANLAFDPRHDAWNRLVEVQEGVSTHYVFVYDGLGRRTSEGEVGPEIYSHFFFNASWQTLIIGRHNMNYPKMG